MTFASSLLRPHSRIASLWTATTVAAIWVWQNRKSKRSSDDRIREHLSKNGFVNVERDDGAHSSHTTGTASEDCPMCREYLAGPCGEQFQSWLDCTNQFKTDYVVTCKGYFATLQNCLQEHDGDISDEESL